jgi:hypothetical protein
VVDALSMVAIMLNLIQYLGRFDLVGSRGVTMIFYCAVMFETVSLAGCRLILKMNSG